MTIEREPEHTARRKVLVTGGRAPAALELVRLLAADGCEVIAADSVRYSLCGASRAVSRSYRVPAPAVDREGFIEALIQIVRRERIDWMIPTCEEIFYVSEGLERLGSHCRVFAAPIGQLLRLHSKWAFIRRAERLGFRVPETKLLRTPEQWRDLADKLAAAPEAGQPVCFADGLVLKPEFSRFGSKVKRIEGADKRSRNPQDYTPPAAEGYPWVAQQRIVGRELCSYSVVRDGIVCAHAVYGAAQSGHGGASVYFRAERHAGIREWVRRFVKLERFTGQIAFDFIETADGELYPLECNPRATSGIHLLGAADGAAAAFFDRVPGVAPVVEPPEGTSRMLGLAMLAGGARSVRSWNALRAWCGQLVRARDVVFRWSDSGPFWMQGALLAELARTARTSGGSLLDASTRDLEWNGGGGAG